MSKLISEAMLPKEKRSSASSKELLSCLEALEDKVVETFSTVYQDTYSTITEQMLSLNEDIRAKRLKLDSEEKDVDRFLKYAESSDKIFASLERIEERAKKKGLFIEEVNISATTRGVKN